MLCRWMTVKVTHETRHFHTKIQIKEVNQTNDVEGCRLQHVQCHRRYGQEVML